MIDKEWIKYYLKLVFGKTRFQNLYGGQIDMLNLF